MKVLVACEFSGVVRDAFRARGHNAWSCDLLDSDSNYHIQGDVLERLNYDWDLMIAHPPCTYLCNSGVRWLHERPERWLAMAEGAIFFHRLLQAPIERICVENPVMHKYARRIIGQDYTQTIQPYEYGEPYTKRTCLWLKNLPPLQPTEIVAEREPQVHHMSPGPERGKLRSITYPGIASAMAEQWGNL